MKEYLGDSVYVEYNQQELKLYTDNGHGPQNIIYLNGMLWIKLERFVKRVRANAEEA